MLSSDNSVILSVDEKDEISIGDVARIIAREFEWEHRIVFDTNFSDGQYKKTADNSKWVSTYGKINMTNIEIGIKDTVKWFIDNYDNLRK